MDTKTRLFSVLTLCVLMLALNVLAVVEEFYVLPESKTTEAALQSISPVTGWYRSDMPGTSAGYPIAHDARIDTDPEALISPL